MKKLFGVTCEIMIDADNEEDAMQRVYAFLEGDITPEINFLVHDAEQDDNFSTLKDLRKHQSAQQITASDGVCTCGKHLIGLIPDDEPCPVAWHNPPLPRR